MKWTGLNDLREKYLSFFEGKAHLRMQSYPLIPQDDSSILLINAGMTPLKKYFQRVAEPPAPRVTTCQKCVRTLDIEQVGKTSRHLSYFEMLGNFSFGDYFKREATAWAWEFLTETLEIPPELLWISIYLDDDEAFEIWTREVGIPAEKIVRLGKEDNFWEHGAGPCGPCSEIYFDRGEKYGCGKPDCAVGCECDRYVEIWNLVFTQFDSDGNGNYTKLTTTNIDTGMGLERLAIVMQGAENVFEIDTMKAIMAKVESLTGTAYRSAEKSDVSLRIITDHIRSTVFLVSDGVVPQNEGRGYVLRRLLRRAARHGRLLGVREPFLHRVCDAVIESNRTAYPELAENADYIKKVIRVEEERFGKTIDQGMEMLNSLIERIKTRILPGEDAFRLYDTFGFPVDLTREIISERKFTLDEEGFLRLMSEQRERARAARASAGAIAWSDDTPAAKGGSTEFSGYDEESAQTAIAGIIRDGGSAESLSEGEEGILILAKTPFYAESGGQVGDRGEIRSGTGVFLVEDCKKSPAGQYLHIGRMRSGMLTPGETVEAAVDSARRMAIRRNHTAAHLLQHALTEVLGDHVHQAGSFVDEHRCRFDFSHFSAMSTDEIRTAERKVNDMILRSISVESAEMPLDKARSIGATALFGEKYGDTVRVVSVGGESIELCGGTHVTNTAQIGLFQILAESSVSAGVRRIEAVTGSGVLDKIAETNELLQKLAQTLKVNGTPELLLKSEALMSELRAKDRQIDELNGKLAEFQAAGLFDSAMQIGPVRVTMAGMSGVKADALRTMGDRIRDSAPDMVAVLCGITDGKASILAVCGSDAVKSGMNAGGIVREVAALCGGKGGGKPDVAMGGTSELFRVDEAIAKVPDIVRSMLKE